MALAPVRTLLLYPEPMKTRLISISPFGTRWRERLIHDPGGDSNPSVVPKRMETRLISILGSDTLWLKRRSLSVPSRLLDADGRCKAWQDKVRCCPVVLRGVSLDLLFSYQDREGGDRSQQPADH